MHVTPRLPDDRRRLDELIRHQSNARQRDRLRAVALALDGGAKLQIAETLLRSKSFVETWVYAYRDGGIDAVAPRKPPGARPKLTPEQAEVFVRRVEAGATDADGVCVLRGIDLQRVLREEFGADYALSGVYALMKRLGYANLTPRPIHEKHDPQRAEAFKASAPFLSGKRPSVIPASGCG